MTWDELKNKFPNTDISTLNVEALEQIGLTANDMYYKLIVENLKNYLYSKFFQDYIGDNSKYNFSTNPIEYIAIQKFEEHFDEIRKDIFMLFDNKDDIIKYINEKI